jgi:hypothetical protein
MKRIGILWSVLIATLALGSLAATTAQAARYVKCEKAEKVGKKLTGDFTDKNCLDRATSAQEAAGTANKFTLRHLTFPPTIATTVTATKFVLQVGASGENLQCKHGHGAGELFDSADLEATLTLEGCNLRSSAGKPAGACTSPGQSAGSIVFPYLAEELSHGEGSFTTFETKEGEAVTQFRILGAQFECEGNGVLERLSEFASGTDKGDVDVSSTKGQLTITAGTGEQQFLVQHGEVLVGAELTATIETKLTEPLELRLCDEPGAISEGDGEEECPPTGRIG